MKEYESIFKLSIPRRTPTIYRFDMRAGHTFTRGLSKPWDEGFWNAMKETAIELCSQIQGTKIAYIQSDEISVLTYSTERNFEQWFGGGVQKTVSVGASVATTAFNKAWYDTHGIDDKFLKAQFDARCFILPIDEVVNYFIWRQQDAARNSVAGLAQANFSAKQIHGLNSSQLQEKLFSEKGLNWNDMETKYKRGFCVKKGEPKEIVTPNGTALRSYWEADVEIPLFTADRDYIERLLC
jgi:tRNA(His) 5'-end guanylyltransferase